MSDMPSPTRPANRLGDETSPYLRQHAHNPVDWYPWGDAALARARTERRLILLSIGYSSCHWCHVMERESFENPAIAALMNEHFVNVKVDREERPDLDEVYMAATLAMNRGQGGWPMTVFLTPELEPVFAGTYFPPEDVPGRPGFPRVLTEIAAAWGQDPDRVRAGAASFVRQLRRGTQTTSPMAVGETDLRLAAQQFAEGFDAQWGGFGPPPKFPMGVGLSLLLRLHRRFGDEQLLTMVQTTLDAMAHGGIYDHIGGGFARYATDREWLVPHFEKMLYDNALLVPAYLEAYQVTGEERYRDVVDETLSYVAREMTGDHGGFFSATDADSEGVEGKYFVWTPSEVEAVVGADDAAVVNAYYDITAAGNWEGRSIPRVRRPMAAVATQFGIDPADLRRQIADARTRLREARARRVPPALDDKVITAWNGMMIGALGQSARVLGRDDHREAAERAADFVLDALRTPDGRLRRTFRAGTARGDGFLEDYAWMAEGLIDLYEAGGAGRYLREAEALLTFAVTAFRDPGSGAFFHTTVDHEQPLFRYREGTDGAVPAANAVVASALARASWHLDRPGWRDVARDAVRAYGGRMREYPRAFAKTLMVVDFLLEGPVEIVVVGAPDRATTAALRRAVATPFLPHRVQALVDPSVADDAVATLPLPRGKGLVGGEPAVYVCRDYACAAPLTDPDAVVAGLREASGGGVAATLTAPLDGAASVEGTARFSGRFEARASGRFGRTGWHASRVGFGGYRVSSGVAEHHEALVHALRSGVNVIDTSTNYMDGESERAVGAAVREIVESGEAARDEIILVSKVGYLQGSAYTRAVEREAVGEGFPDVVKVEEGLWHCIHPVCVADQLDRSLERLEVTTLDVALLHNPEYYLAAAGRTSQTLPAIRDTFYGRLERAFAHLEREVEAGRIQWYGVSSNTLGAPATAADAVSLSRVLDAARAAGGEGHHLAVVQAPLNLYEGSVRTEGNTGPGRSDTVGAAAARADLALVTNRPLNAWTGTRMVRLADPPESSGGAGWLESHARVAELETAFAQRLASQIGALPDGIEPSQLFAWAEALDTIRRRTPSLEELAQLEGQVSYAAGQAMATLDQAVPADVTPVWHQWRTAYAPALHALLTALRDETATRARAWADRVAAALNPHLPAAERSQPLARMALWVVASTPGVTTVLAGMRRVAYVEDALAVSGWERLSEVGDAYAAVAATVD